MFKYYTLKNVSVSPHYLRVEHSMWYYAGKEGAVIAKSNLTLKPLFFFLDVTFYNLSLWKIDGMNEWTDEVIHLGIFIN